MPLEITKNYYREGCQGCLSAARVKCYYFIKGAASIVKCPCRKCLVKGICREACDDFEKHDFTTSRKNIL